MFDNALLIFVGIFTATYVLARMADAAERSKKRQVSKLVEEARQRRLRSLYGREGEE